MKSMALLLGCAPWACLTGESGVFCKPLSASRRVGDRETVLEAVPFTGHKAGQPTHYPVICSVPDIPMTAIIKEKFRAATLFHGVLCLEQSERNGYNYE